MRYISQAFEIPVKLDSSSIEQLDAAALQQRFEAEHKRIFEFDEGGRKRCEIVSFRAGGAVPPEEIPALSIELLADGSVAARS